MDADSKTPLASGNTMAEATEQNSKYKKEGKLFLLTVNPSQLEHYEEIMDYIRHWSSLRYYLVVEHIGQKQPHYHVLAQYKNSVVFRPGKAYNVHIKKCTASIQKGIAYCMCTDEKHIAKGVTARKIDEYGEPANRGGINRKTLISMDKDEVPANLLRVHKEVVNEQRELDGFMDMLDEIEKDTLAAPDVIYIIGQPGEGKTYGAYKLALQLFPKQDIGRIKFCNQFASITNPIAKCFVIEEFRASDLRASELLQLLDKYGTNVNTKGGFCYIRAKCIIICSIFQPDELYQRDELCEQFERRITKMYKAIDHELEQIK